MKSIKIGIDNYSLFPLDLNPMETLEWAMKFGAEGVAFSGLNKKNIELADKSYLLDMLEYTKSNDLYIEWGGAQHIPRDLNTWGKIDIFENNRKVAEEANILETKIIRSCSGGLMRWNPESIPTDILLKEMIEVLKSQKQMLRDNNAILAIETHFEFTTHELFRLFEECDAEPGDYLGICLDTMNLLTMLEDPEMATERILPWVVSTHIKDGGILMNNNGFKSFPTRIGQGCVNIKNIITRIGSLPNEIFLSIEDHGGDFDMPVFDEKFLKEFPDLNSNEFNKLKQLSQITENKIKTGECAIINREKMAFTM
ncbi:sugar phosphate isomerase/epimerase family protein [Bacteroidota bacterium]